MKEKLIKLYVKTNEENDLTLEGIDLDDFFSIHIAKYDELIRLIGWGTPDLVEKYNLRGFDDFEVTEEGWLIATNEGIEITFQM